MNGFLKAGLIAGAVVGVPVMAGAGIYACTRAPEAVRSHELELLNLSDLRASQIGDQIRQAAIAVYPYDTFKQLAVSRYAELEKKRYYCATESAYDFIKYKTAKCSEPTSEDPSANLSCIAIALNAKISNVLLCSETYVKQEEALLCRMCSGPVCGASHNCAGTR